MALPIVTAIQYQMKKDDLQYETRKTRIYKDMYRPSSNPTHFFSTLLSVLLLGHSQVGTSNKVVARRRH